MNDVEARGSAREQNTEEELHPARPETAEERAYMPKIPWKWIVSIGGFLVLSYVMYNAREQREADALKAALLKTRGGELAPVVARYEAITEKIRRHTAESARAGAPETKVDPRLNIDALGTGKGLYLRLTADQFPLASKLDEAKLDEAPDAIGKCLGLAPYSAGELLARGSFLEKGWIKQAEEADSLLKLRVVAEELKQRSQRDLPYVLDALQAQWFLLVLERGENRRDAPVDVYLWDLRNDDLLLRTRAQAAGALVSARIAVSGVTPGHYATGAQTGAAQDCSIASQLRTLVGSQPAEFGSQPPTPRALMEPAAAPAANGPAAAPAANGPAAVSATPPAASGPAAVPAATPPAAAAPGSN